MPHDTQTPVTDDLRVEQHPRGALDSANADFPERRVLLATLFLARDLGYDQGFGEGRVEEQMEQCEREMGRAEQDRSRGAVPQPSHLKRAPRFMDAKEVDALTAGSLLCSEPWMPCWDRATYRRDTEKGVMVTCWGCGIVGESVPLVGSGSEAASDEEERCAHGVHWGGHCPACAEPREETT